MLRKSKIRNRMRGDMLGERMPQMPGSGSAKVLAPPTGWTGWYKATLATATPNDKFTDLGTTPVTNGGAIRQWSNQSGSNHMLQATLADRGIYNTSLTLNGYAGVTFDGVTDKLQSALDNSPFTMVVVGRFLGADPVGTNGRMIGYAAERSLFQDGTNYGVYFTTGGVLSLGVAQTTNSSIIIRWEPGVSNQVRLNGANVGAMQPNAAAATTGAMTLGARSNGLAPNDEEGYCIVYEAMHYPYIITAAEITALEAYLRAKFATW